MERRLEIVIDPRKAISGAEQVTRATTKVTAAGKKATESFKELTKQFGDFSSDVRNLSRGLSTRSFDAIVKSLEANEKAMNSLIKTTSTLDGQVKKLGNTATSLGGKFAKATSGLDKYENKLKSAQKESQGLRKSTMTMQQAVMGFALTVGSLQVGGLVADTGRMLDTFTEWENKLAVVTGGTVDLTKATNDLVQVSIRSRTDMTATMDLYSKMTRVNQQYGFSQQDILQITETVSQAIAMSGASVQGAQGAILQFAQALSGNFKASAQELNSIIEQTPGLAQAVAQALGTTTDKLKILAKDGLIETKDVLEGLLRIAPEVRMQFERSNITIAQSLGGLKDAVTNLLGQNEKLNEGARRFAKSIQEIALNLAEYEKVIVALGVTLGTLTASVLPALLAAFVVMIGPIGQVILLLGAAAGAGAGLAAALIDTEIELTEVAKSARETNSVLSTSSERVSELAEDYDELVIAMRNANILDRSDMARSLWEERSEEINKVYNNIQRLNREYTLLQEKYSNGGLSEKEMHRWSDVGVQLDAARELYSSLKKPIDELNNAFWEGLVAGEAFGDAVEEELAERIRKGNIALDELMSTIKDPKAQKAWKTYYDTIEQISTAQGSAEKEAEALKVAWDVLQKSLNGNTKATRSNIKAVKEQGKSYEELLAIYDPAQRILNEYNKEVIDIENSTATLTEKVILLAEAEAKRDKSLQDLQKTQSGVKDNSEELAKAYEKEQKRLRDLAESYADTFMDGIRSAMEGLDSFKDWFKNHLKEMALMALRNQIIIPITSQLVGGGSGSLLGGGSGGGLTDLISMGKSGGNIFDIVSSGFDSIISDYFTGSGLNPFQASFNTFARSSVGASLGLSQASTGYNPELLAQGFNEVIPTLSDFGSMVSEALGMIGGGLTAYGVSQEHGPVAGTLAGVGSMTLGAGIGAMMGGGSFMAAAGAMLTNPVGWIVAGLGALLGMGDKPSDKTQYTSIDVATGQTFEQGFEGSKFDQEIRDFTTAMGNQIAALSNYMSASTGTVLEGFGLDLAVGQLKGLRLQRSDYETGEQVTIIQRGAEEAEAFMEDIENYLAEVYGMQIEVYRDLGKETESLLQSMIRLDGQVAAVKDSVGLVGSSFDATGDDAIRYSDVIVGAAGGLESFVQGLLRFNQAMVANTPGLQFLDQVSNLSALFNDIGVSSLPTTNEGFQELLNSLDITTEYGQTLYGALIKLAPQFFDFTASLENLFDVITPLTDLSQSIREQMMSEEELYNLRKTQAEDLAATLNTLTDPTEVANTVAEIERLTNQAWSGLSESQKQAMGEEFISFLEQTAAIATVQLENLTANAITEGATEEGVSQQQAADLSRQASENMALAADELSSASQALLAAARELSSFTENTQQGEREIDYR